MEELTKNDTKAILKRRVELDENIAVRCEAIRELAKGWPHDPDTLAYTQSGKELRFWECGRLVRFLMPQKFIQPISCTVRIFPPTLPTLPTPPTLYEKAYFLPVPSISQASGRVRLRSRLGRANCSSVRRCSK